MSRASRVLSKVPNYVRRFGLLAGTRLLLQVERPVPARSATLKPYRVPGYPLPIWLRESLPDHAIFWQCLVAAQYDLSRFPQTARVLTFYRLQLQRGIRPLVIDCGANIGLATLWFARQFPEAAICAIEPDASNFELLKANARPFLDRVTLLRGGVWSESGYLRIVDPDAGSAAFTVERCDQGAEGRVRAYTIDEVCSLVGAESPLIVKIDIEGAQQELFRANTEWVGRTHLIALELDDWLMPWRGTSRSFFSCVSRYPFDYLISGETIFCFRDFETQVVESPDRVLGSEEIRHATLGCK